MKYYVVKYEGHFGFIKPWTAVRDGETFSQQFLTPSIVEGMRQKLEVKKILRHKLTYSCMSKQQEVVQSKGWKVASSKQNRKKKFLTIPTSILDRMILLYPDLYLAFDNFEDAQKASQQHLCLCRNEDLIFPTEEIRELTKEQFDNLDGFELIFESDNEASFLVGYNRFEASTPMYGWINVSDNPLKNHEEI